MPPYAGFIAIWITLIAAPIVAATVVWRRRISDRGGIKRLAWFGSAWIAIFTVCMLVGLQTSIAAINFLICLSLFPAYCILAAASWTMRPKAVGMGLGIVASVPLALSYLLSTIGALGLVFIVGDNLTAPLATKELRAGLTCEIRGWGAAFSDSGYDVHLYRYLPWFPLIRREVRVVRVNETNPGNGPTSADCASVAARFT